MLPSIFNDNLFDAFFNFPFYDDKAERRAEKKLYGHHAHNLMKTDIKEKKDGEKVVGNKKMRKFVTYNQLNQERTFHYGQLHTI